MLLVLEYNSSLTLGGCPEFYSPLMNYQSDASLGTPHVARLLQRRGASTYTKTGSIQISIHTSLRWDSN